MTFLCFRSTIFSLSLLAMCVAGLSGCGGDNHKDRAPVHGRVTYNSKPVVGAEVTFIREGAGIFSTGKTDTEGHYSLSTYSLKDGAFLGHNVIAVTMPSDASSVPAPDMTTGEGYFEAVRESQEQARKPNPLLRYASPGTSGLSHEIVTGENQVDLKLSDKK